MSKSLQALIQAYFGKELRDLRFEKAPEGPHLYHRTIGNVLQRLDFERERWFPALHVSLSEEGERRRHISLAAFDDRPGGRYDFTLEGGMEPAVVLAARDFRAYGLRWLEGEDVITPAIAQSRAAHRDFTYNRLIREGRECFKKGQHDAAVQKLMEAQSLCPLGELDLKFLQSAQGRVGNGG